MRKLRRRGFTVSNVLFPHTSPANIMTWLNNQGYTGSFSDALMNYFKDQSGLSVGTLDDHVSQAMTAAGFPGPTLRDQLAAYFSDQTGISYYPDAERAFFGDYSVLPDSNQLQFNGDNLQFNGDSLQYSGS